jgi:hypothetical protein
MHRGQITIDRTSVGFSSVKWTLHKVPKPLHPDTHDQTYRRKECYKKLNPEGAWVRAVSANRGTINVKLDSRDSSISNLAFPCSRSVTQLNTSADAKHLRKV